MATRPGLEPGTTGPKPVVLPITPSGSVWEGDFTAPLDRGQPGEALEFSAQELQAIPNCLQLNPLPPRSRKLATVNGEGTLGTR